MTRLLVFCLHDWLNPRAGPIEHYAHEVFRRIVARGHPVAWVCHNYPLLSIRTKRRPRVETVDGIQMVRVAPRPLYRPMVKLFLSRFVRNGKLAQRFDVMIDCVNGHPLPLGDYAQIPILPLVFRLNPRVHGSDDPPGPILAATAQARNALSRAGTPQDHIVELPMKTDGAACGNTDQHAVSALWEEAAGIVLATAERL